ncbi:MAG: sigma-70 family RNA polymerase sigma factor [Heliobacteriaceae bacterium]|nr:sigma-70 family RNA polymerase sigma factor [Heliobacteriaceae bacterium]MDD4587814.1 sigma-70 family RNA polymerase sigma factor [Heliobacteriaceae bacterium]
MVFDEEQIIAAAKAGDRAAFEQLVLVYQRKVYTIAYRFMGNPDDAKDLAQEALLKTYYALPGFRGEASFATWLHRIVASVCRDELRRRTRRAPADHRGWAAGRGGIQPEEVVLKREQDDRLQTLINTMAPEYRLVLVMRDIQGLTYEEIAAIMGVAMGTVKSRLSRARYRLKELLLADNYFTPEVLAPEPVWEERRQEG